MPHSAMKISWVSLLSWWGCCLLVVGCHRPAAVTSAAPLQQRGYLWQRDWTPAVQRAVSDAGNHMDGLVLLGAEIRWNGSTARPVRASIRWDMLKSAAKPYSIALRVAPYTGPFASNNAPARAVADMAKSLLQDAAQHGVKLTEFQLDFDCAQKKLAGYQVWLRMLRSVVHPLPLVITTLPAWLDEREFPALVRETDGYVLQVHSVPTQAESGRAVLCDAGLARKWVAKAAKLDVPFSVSLPTYRCLAGYGPSGNLLGIAMDSIQPAWPPGTAILDFGTDPDEVASLVNEWRTSRPANMKGLLWYRVPVATDMRNWRWQTLSCVMDGRRPVHQLEIVHTGNNPTDIVLSNNGEAEERLDCDVVVTWKEGDLVAADALGRWSVSCQKKQAIFSPSLGPPLRLFPGEAHDIGWLRYDKETPFKCRMEKHTEANH